MTDPGSPGTITSLLQRARAGEAGARDELFAQIYVELRSMARWQMRKQPPGVLQATALVNAACERLLKKQALDAEDRKHLFFVLSRAMHDELVDHVKAERAAKRGGDHRRVPLVEFESDGQSMCVDLLDLREALDRLAKQDPDGANLVMLRFFGGRTLEEAAAMMGRTFAVARKDWEYAKAWLHKRLSDTAKPSRM